VCLYVRVCVLVCVRISLRICVLCRLCSTPKPKYQISYQELSTLPAVRSLMTTPTLISVISEKFAHRDIRAYM